MIEELAKDYSAYAKADIRSHMKNVHESIEDMMVRLEEFESIIGMVKTPNSDPRPVSDTGEMHVQIPVTNWGLTFYRKSYDESKYNKKAKKRNLDSAHQLKPINSVQTTAAESNSEYRPRLQSVAPELLTLCKRIDALEHIVARANVDLTALEMAVENAEAELGGVGVSDRLLGILNPISHLFKLKNAETPVTTRTVTSFEQPSIYKTKDFFNSE